MVVVADGPGHLNVPNGTPLEKKLQTNSFRIGHDVYREVSNALTNKSRTLNNTTYEKKFPQPQGITPVYIENDAGSKRDISYMSIKGDVANDKFTITGKPAGQPAVQSTGFSFKIGDDSVDFPFIDGVVGLPSVKTLGEFATEKQTKVFKAEKITVEFPKNLKKESIKSVLQQLDRRYTHDDTFTLIISEDELPTGLSNELYDEQTEVFEAQKSKNVVYLGRQPPHYLRPGNNISVTEIEQNEQKESLYLVVIKPDTSDTSDTYPKAFPPFLSGFFHQSTEKKSTMRAPVVSLKERGATVFLNPNIGETVIGNTTTLRKQNDSPFIEATDQEIQDAFTEQVERYNKLFKALGKDNALPLEEILKGSMPPQQGNEILTKRYFTQRRESYNSSLSYSTEQSFPNIPSGSFGSSTSKLNVKGSDYSIEFEKYEKLDGRKYRPSLYKVIYKDSESSLILPFAILKDFTKNHYLKQGTREAIKQAKELGGKQQNKGQHKGQVLTAAQIVKGQQVASVDKMKVVKRPTIKEVLDNCQPKKILIILHRMTQIIYCMEAHLEFAEIYKDKAKKVREVKGKGDGGSTAMDAYIGTVGLQTGLSLASGGGNNELDIIDYSKGKNEIITSDIKDPPNNIETDKSKANEIFNMLDSLFESGKSPSKYFDSYKFYNLDRGDSAFKTLSGKLKKYVTMIHVAINNCMALLRESLLEKHKEIDKEMEDYTLTRDILLTEKDKIYENEKEFLKENEVYNKMVNIVLSDDDDDDDDDIDVDDDDDDDDDGEEGEEGKEGKKDYNELQTELKKTRDEIIDKLNKASSLEEIQVIKKNFKNERGLRRKKNKNIFPSLGKQKRILKEVNEIEDSTFKLIEDTKANFRTAEMVEEKSNGTYNTNKRGRITKMIGYKSKVLKKKKKLEATRPLTVNNSIDMYIKVVLYNNTYQVLLKTIDRLSPEFKGSLDKIDFSLEKCMASKGEYKRTSIKEHRRDSRPTRKKNPVIQAFKCTWHAYLGEPHGHSSCGGQEGIEGCANKKEEDNIKKLIKEEEIAGMIPNIKSVENKVIEKKQEEENKKKQAGGGFDNDYQFIKNNPTPPDMTKINEMKIIKATFEKQKEIALQEDLTINEPNRSKKSFDLKFDEEVMFFQNKDRLVIEFTKYLMNTVTIPIRVFNYFRKKKKLEKRVDKHIKDLETKYNIINLEKDPKNKDFVIYLQEYKKNTDTQQEMRKILADKNNPQETQNETLQHYGDNELIILQKKEQKIREDPKVRKYFQDSLKLDNYREQLIELEKTYLLLKEETEKFEDNMETKKRKFYALNILFLEEIAYIQNEFDMAYLNSTYIKPEDKKIHLKSLKDIYTFYYVLKYKLESKLKTILELKEEANEEFKRVYLLDIQLNDDIKKLTFPGEKIKKQIEIDDMKKELLFHKYNYYNIKKSILFKTDLLYKCYHFLIFVDYSRININGLYLYKAIENKIINNRGVIDMPKKSVISEGKIDKLSYEDILKILGKINKHLKNLINSKKRLYQKRSEIHTTYSEKISESIKMSTEIVDSKIVPNRDKKDLQDAETIKKLKEDGEIKIRRQSLLQDLTDINRRYLKIPDPIKLLINSNVLKNKPITVTDKKTKKKGVNVEVQLYQKILNSYTPEQQSTLLEKIKNINTNRKNLGNFNSYSSLHNFIPRFTRKNTY